MLTTFLYHKYSVELVTVKFKFIINFPLEGLFPHLFPSSAIGGWNLNKLFEIKPLDEDDDDEIINNYKRDGKISNNKQKSEEKKSRELSKDIQSKGKSRKFPNRPKNIKSYATGGSINFGDISEARAEISNSSREVSEDISEKSVRKPGIVSWDRHIIVIDKI